MQESVKKTNEKETKKTFEEILNSMKSKNDLFRSPSAPPLNFGNKFSLMNNSTDLNGINKWKMNQIKPTNFSEKALNPFFKSTDQLIPKFLDLKLNQETKSNINFPEKMKDKESEAVQKNNINKQETTDNKDIINNNNMPLTEEPNIIPTFIDDEDQEPDWLEKDFILNKFSKEKTKTTQNSQTKFESPQLQKAPVAQAFNTFPWNQAQQTEYTNQTYNPFLQFQKENFLDPKINPKKQTISNMNNTTKEEMNNKQTTTMMNGFKQDTLHSIPRTASPEFNNGFSDSITELNSSNLRYEVPYEENNFGYFAENNQSFVFPRGYSTQAYQRNFYTPPPRGMVQYSYPYDAYQGYGNYNENTKNQFGNFFDQSRFYSQETEISIHRTQSYDRQQNYQDTRSNNTHLGIYLQGVNKVLSDIALNRNVHFYGLKDVFGSLYEFSIDQHGSRFIQLQIEKADQSQLDKLFQEIRIRFFDLIQNIFGNYVVQKFFSYATETQITELVTMLKNKVYIFTTHIYGCRVIQKALEVSNEKQKEDIIKELEPKILDCIDDQNGNHVIQKCIECLPQKLIQFIIDKFAEQPLVLSKHPYGCRVIQRILNHCSGSQVDKITKEILNVSSDLVFDQFGNYVVQHILENGTNEQRNIIIQKVFGKVLKMSQHKYASNAIEKCIEFGTLQQTKKILNEILKTIDVLQIMVNDPYANYVIQKFLEKAKGKDQQRLISAIKQNIHILDTSNYGKHVLAKMTDLGWI
ncbi:pumilio 2 [Anaeramoeba ignava]|uniref:Pumilio 2 n=1 Tax=Anaeramoeba ignava TaxID=1746090 RepID=A0A9Q0LNJ0_ANAIG|nr:pumilio 2 [Anaeramoeba ignava]